MTIKTIPHYWDCECEHKYIHSRFEETECLKCGALAEDQPDSRANEVLIHLKPKNIFTEEGLRFQELTAHAKRRVVIEHADLKVDGKLMSFDEHMAHWSASEKLFSEEGELIEEQN